MISKETKTGEIEIDVLEVLKALWNRALIIVIAMVVFAAAGFAYTKFMVTPQYQSSIACYVDNSSNNQVNTAYQISTTELYAAQSLVSTYLKVLTLRTTLEEIGERAGVGYTTEQLGKMISGSALDETELFTITVTSTDADEACRIANTIAEVLPEKIGEMIKNSSVYIADTAVPNYNPTSPSYSKNIIIAACLGLLVSAAIVLVIAFKDDTIYEEPAIKATAPDIPILCTLPDLASEGGGKYGGRYASRYASRYERSYARAYSEDHSVKDDATRKALSRAAGGKGVSRQGASRANTQIKEKEER